MPKINKKFQQKAQSLMEYVSLITIIVVVFITMGTYIRRGVQGFVKVAADQLANQANAEQAFDDTGHLMNAVTISRSALRTERRERMGVINYIYNDQAEMDSTTILNAGFSFDPSN